MQRGAPAGKGRLPVQHAEHVQQDDHDDRHAEQPQKSIAAHGVLVDGLQHAEEMHQDDSADRHAQQPENEAATRFELPISYDRADADVGSLGALDHVEEVHQDDDADRHANQPQENTAHFFELRVVAGPINSPRTQEFPCLGGAAGAAVVHFNEPAAGYRVAVRMAVLGRHARRKDPRTLKA